MALIATLRGEIKQDKADDRAVAEAKKVAGELQKVAAELQAFKDAQLTEEQRVTQERDDLLAQQETWQREKRDTTLKLAVYSATAELGIADADLAIAALDHSQVEWSAEGKPENLEVLLTDLLERKPLLKTTAVPRIPPSSDGAAGSGSQTPPELTAEEAEFALQQGIPLERYAQMKQVKSIDDFNALRRKANP